MQTTVTAKKIQNSISDVIVYGITTIYYDIFTPTILYDNISKKIISVAQKIIKNYHQNMSYIIYLSNYQSSKLHKKTNNITHATLRGFLF